METKIKKSAVSSVISKTMESFRKNQPLIEDQNKTDFYIKIANTLDERAAVFQLGYQIYLDKGYIKQNSNEWLIHNYDFDSETVILIVQDQYKNLVGSVSIVFDEASRLPAESIYHDEIEKLRNSGSRMAELSRLIINPQFRNSKEVLILLFNYLAIYIHHVKKYNSFIVQVNPRHKNYYKALLDFVEIGKEKPCPHVLSAPAILMYLSTSHYQNEIIRCFQDQNMAKKERSLYHHFLNSEQEKLVAYYLSNQKKIMTMEERLYFGYSESGMINSVSAL